jgi:hypothetical protein
MSVGEMRGESKPTFDHVLTCKIYSVKINGTFKVK